MRTLAIDLGTRRVGLALSDEGGRFATPFDMIEVTDPADALRPVAELIAREAVQRLVIGLPLNMDDTLGPPARRAIDWGRRLGQLVALPLFYVDERLSSYRAQQSLSDRRRAGEKLTRADKKARIDALAAAAFLQDFLDGTLPGLSGDEVD